jgi:hypothetical protein
MRKWRTRHSKGKKVRSRQLCLGWLAVNAGIRERTLPQKRVFMRMIGATDKQCGREAAASEPLRRTGINLCTWYWATRPGMEELDL